MANHRSILRAVAPAACALPLILSPQTFAEDHPGARGGSPCAGSLAYLEQRYREDAATRQAFETVLAGLTNQPPGYSDGGSRKNPWRVGSGKALFAKMRDTFKRWCVALPKIEGDEDNALAPILHFAWFYYRNQAGIDFVQGRDPANRGQPLETGPAFLAQWGQEYRQYMDSRASAKRVPEWVEDPRIEIGDYVITDPAGYESWNQLFARNLKSDSDGNYPSRPVTMPERDYVIVAPTDCIMNPLVQAIELSEGEYRRTFVDNPLQLDTVLDVKNIPISVDAMLGSAPKELKAQFVGGTGLACVLMPNTYHHFHAPVDGVVVHAEVVDSDTPGTPGTFGYSDFPNWVPNDGNVGRPGTDFSQFQAFQRGVIIIEVEYDNLPGAQPAKLTGYVASIPVGLNSVGSVVLNRCDDPAMGPGGTPVTDGVNCFDFNGPVTKGKTKLGNFFFGGSLDILLFSAGMVTPAIQTRMGNQIGVINIGSSPVER